MKYLLDAQPQPNTSRSCSGFHGASQQWFSAFSALFLGLLAPRDDTWICVNNTYLLQVEELVKDAIEKGADPVCGGGLQHEMGANFFAPTLLSGCTLDMRIGHEEIFGPVVAVMKFKEAGDALSLSNRCVSNLLVLCVSGVDPRGEALHSTHQQNTVCGAWNNISGRGNGYVRQLENQRWRIVGISTILISCRNHAASHGYLSHFTQLSALGAGWQGTSTRRTTPRGCGSRESWMSAW